MARLRTFIALDLGKSIRDLLVGLQGDFAEIVPGVKWVEPPNLHVTLLFLGEVDNREIPAICRAVDSVTQTMRPFPLALAGMGCFPNARRPNVLWVGLGAGAQEVCTLHDALEPPLLELGCYRREQRKYTPHITLGRIRSDEPPAGFAKALADQESWSAGETTIREVHVMSSELSSNGPTYTVLARAKLNGSA